MNLVLKFLFWFSFLWLAFLMVSSVAVLIFSDQHTALNFYEHFVFQWYNVIVVVLMMIRVVTFREDKYQLY